MSEGRSAVSGHTAKSRARGWALQVLYAWEARAPDGEPEDMLERFFAERRIAPRSRPHLKTLISRVSENLDSVDRTIENALTNWRMERLSVIDRNILRLAATELLMVPETPPRVAIQEAIILAEKYGTHQSPGFVNGVLDAIYKQEPGSESADRPPGED